MITTPARFEDAINKLDQRLPIVSQLTSEQWRTVPLALRERAFFSAQVESARFIQQARTFLQDYLANERETLPNGEVALKSGRARFVAEMQKKAIAWGMEPMGKHPITDPASESRLKLIFDVQRKQANDYGNHLQGMDPDVLNEFPAQRFVRVARVRDPRPYHEANLGQVRRKDDTAFWLEMNRDFRVPWGPWGFNSGCDVHDVDRDEAEALGLVDPDEWLDPQAADFNAELEASTRGLDPDVIRTLQGAFGHSVEIDGERVRWRNTRPAPKPVSRKPVSRKPEPEPEPIPELATAEEVRRNVLDTITRAEGHAAISLPQAARAKLKPKNRVNPKLKGTTDKATEFLGTILHRSWTPKTPWRAYVERGRRAKYRPSTKTAYIHAGDVSTAAHEIMHHIEIDNPAILEAARKFLASRAKEGETAKSLRELTGIRAYRKSEITIEDEWASKGGNVYTGRVYDAAGRIDATPFTEIMTMGAERLYRDPRKFAQQDPDFFDFMIRTLHRSR